MVVDLHGTTLLTRETQHLWALHFNRDIMHSMSDLLQFEQYKYFVTICRTWNVLLGLTVPHLQGRRCRVCVSSNIETLVICHSYTHNLISHYTHYQSIGGFWNLFKTATKKKGCTSGWQASKQARKFAFVNLAQLTLLTQHSGWNSSKMLAFQVFPS